MEGRKKLLKGLGVASRWQANSTKKIKAKTSEPLVKELRNYSKT
jgi:hypothetical protein